MDHKSYKCGLAHVGSKEPVATDIVTVRILGLGSLAVPVLTSRNPGRAAFACGNSRLSPGHPQTPAAKLPLPITREQRYRHSLWFSMLSGCVFRAVKAASVLFQLRIMNTTTWPKACLSTPHQHALQD